MAAKSIFIVTKPVQLINAENICNQEKIGNKILLLVDNFNDSYTIKDKIEAYGFWDYVFIFGTKEKALYESFLFGEVDLYVDGDVGLSFYKTFILSKMLCAYKRNIRNLFVYEEGIGTYCKNKYNKGLKKNILSNIGVGVFFGGFYKTKKIYVYNKELYAYQHKSDKLIVKINEPMFEYVIKNITRFVEYFGDQELLKKEKTAIVYLSNYTLSLEYIFNIYGKYKNCDFFIKLHPHIKEAINPEFSCTVIDNKVPFEVAVFKLLLIYDDIVVLHHGSSAGYYIKNVQVSFVKIK
ncbi:polysialyltransferase family glycosyltransferase [Photobacterium phosphoreum]|uniref:polysialyltransferase family glycosyltransferase n=1 Tax=Photobacterium phosphoreum TaxID=659 RepID=UPI0024B909E5|nr:polysialyltransferase family glycosyltransferase [Photobacterium phosphoreum]